MQPIGSYGTGPQARRSYINSGLIAIKPPASHLESHGGNYGVVELTPRRISRHFADGSADRALVAGVS